MALARRDSVPRFDSPGDKNTAMSNCNEPAREIRRVKGYVREVRRTRGRHRKHTHKRVEQWVNARTELGAHLAHPFAAGASDGSIAVPEAEVSNPLAKGPAV